MILIDFRYPFGTISLLDRQIWFCHRYFPILTRNPENKRRCFKVVPPPATSIWSMSHVFLGKHDPIRKKSLLERESFWYWLRQNIRWSKLTWDPSKRLTKVGSMLIQRRRRWPNINPALVNICCLLGSRFTYWHLHRHLTVYNGIALPSRRVTFNVGTMLDQRRKRWSNIMPTLGSRLFTPR